MHFNDPSAEAHHSYANNVIRTAKYNIITFLPLFLFDVFRKSSYLYFLVMAVLAWIPDISPYSGWGNTLALLFVVVVAAVKALFEDVKRQSEDRMTNGSKAK